MTTQLLHKRNELPEGAYLLSSLKTLSLGSFTPQIVDAAIEKYGVTWYRVKGGFGGRNDREDWIADLPISVSIHDYHWNGEDFGPDYGSFENAMYEELKKGLELAHLELQKAIEIQSSMDDAITLLERVLL